MFCAAITFSLACGADAHFRPRGKLASAYPSENFVSMTQAYCLSQANQIAYCKHLKLSTRGRVD